MLYGVALGYVGSEAEAEDVVQDAFVALWRNRDRLQPIKGRDDAQRYFTQVVKHTSIDHLRRQQARHTTPEEDLEGWQPLDSGLTPYDRAAARADLDRLKAIVATLPAKPARAFALFHFDGLEIGEVAARMGEAEGYVRVMLSRARKYVKEHYEHEG